MRAWMTLLVALVLGVSPVHADEAKLSAALDAFEQLALWHDPTGLAAGGAAPTGGIVRWNQALRVRVVGRSSSSERASTLKFLRQAAEIAGLAITVEDGEGSGENFKIEFFPEYSAPPMLQNAGCLTRYWNTGGAMTRVELYIRSGSRGFDHCVAHEMLHGFGFPAHPHALRSIMSYTQQGLSDFTPIDVEALRTLYHPSIAPGMYHLPAMLAARKAIAERMELIPAGGDANALARPTMDKALARLREFSQGTARVAPVAAAQLGNAYWFGHYVAIDRAEAIRFWRIAADKEHADACFFLGNALSQGQAVPRDDVAAVELLEKAAKQGHTNAMLALAGLIAQGRGGKAVDPVEAFAWLTVAASRNTRDAVAARDKLAGILTPEQIEAGRDRATKLVPQPAR